MGPDVCWHGHRIRSCAIVSDSARLETNTMLEMCELVPMNASLSAFHGFIRVGDEQFKIQVSRITYFPDHRMNLSKADLQCESQLAAMLGPVEHLVRLCLHRAGSLTGFVKELKDLITKSISKSSSQSLLITPLSQPNHSKTALPSAQFYAQIVAELDQIGWNHLVYMNDQWNEMELQTYDEAQRVHCLRLGVSPHYPLQAPICTADAPEEFTLQWQNGFALGDVLQQFQLFLQQFQDFWRVLDDLDAKCCVLEPKQPSRATGKRRVALAKHASIQFEIDPKQPFGILCDLNFFGNEETTSKLRNKWNSNLFQWNEHHKVRKNLQKLLEIEFPLPTQQNQQEFAVECGICYCYRLEREEIDPKGNGKGKATATASKSSNIVSSSSISSSSSCSSSLIPNRMCENAHCNRAFHEKCLLEWLKSLPNARQSLNTVFGECPYCREAITARLL